MQMKIFVALVLSVFLTSTAAEAGGKRWVFNLVGSGDMYEGTVPDIDGDGFDDDAFCFDIELVNAKNRQLIGTATDCLSNIGEGAEGGLLLVGTTYFHLPQGTLITRGNTTVQPVNGETKTTGGHPMTHITGASGDGDAVLGGTGVFAGRSGTVRLSGLVDLSSFDGVGTPIVFDCLFIVDLE